MPIHCLSKSAPILLSIFYMNRAIRFRSLWKIILKSSLRAMTVSTPQNLSSAEIIVLKHLNRGYPLLNSLSEGNKCQKFGCECQSCNFKAHKNGLEELDPPMVCQAVIYCSKMLSDAILTDIHPKPRIQSYKTGMSPIRFTVNSRFGQMFTLSRSVIRCGCLLVSYRFLS